MAEESNTGSASQEQSDFDKVQGYLKEQVGTLFQQELQQYQQQAQRAQGITPEQQQQQALREYLNPVIQPELQAIRVEAADARDLAAVMHDPLYQEYKTEVEDLFQQTKKAGRPMPRQDLLQYVMGKEARENPTKFKERLAAHEKDQLDRAASAADMGAGNIARNPSALAATMEEFAKLPSEEQLKYLDGVTF